MANKHQGSCLCGRVKYELSGDFQSFFLCHCIRCQKDTGSAHAANLFAKASTLTWLKGESDAKTYQHPYSMHAKSFCQICGSALPTIAESINSVVVPAGSLDSIKLTGDIMKKRTRRLFSAEFKLEAAQLVLEQNYSKMKRLINWLIIGLNAIKMRPSASINASDFLTSSLH